MFRPSTSLLSRPAFSNLRIHHPLPLSPRESNELLKLLTTSFRHNLDAEHPAFRMPDNASRSPKQTPKRRHSISDLDQHPTDRHLHSVLSNPLFFPPKANLVGKDPMDVFDMAVAKGLMETRYAKACLKAKKDKIVQSPVLNVRDGMAESGAGLKVVGWLISSGTSADNQFLKDQAFATLLMEFMVADGLQEHAWKWIKRAFQQAAAVSALPAGELFESARREIAGPLRALVRAELEHNVTLDNAYMCISRAAGYLDGATSRIMTTALQPAGMMLVKETCKLDSTHPPPAESSFESFISLVPIITPSKANIYLAHLSLIHPTKGDPAMALDYLRAEASSERKMWASANERSIVIQLGLDTAKRLLEQRRYSEMEWTMSFLSQHFPEQLGIMQKRQLEQVKAEASSIELLSNIGIA